MMFIVYVLYSEKFNKIYIGYGETGKNLHHVFPLNEIDLDGGVKTPSLFKLAEFTEVIKAPKLGITTHSFL